MKNRSYGVVGVSPILLCSNRLANPLDPLTKELKKVTGKKKKTDEDYETIARIEFEGHLYFDSAIGPHIPANVIDATLREAAKLQRRGRDVIRGLTCIEDKVKLEYSGPRTIEKLWADTKFVDIRPAGNQQITVMRCRPIFREWSLKFSVAFDEQVLNDTDIDKFVSDAGSYIGLCDYRPRFGKFASEVLA